MKEGIAVNRILLEITGLRASADGGEILKGLDFDAGHAP
jgi:hypothetical protein